MSVINSNLCVTPRPGSFITKLRKTGRLTQGVMGTNALKLNDHTEVTHGVACSFPNFPIRNSVPEIIKTSDLGQTQHVGW
ncbi:hypothetical protein GDO81_026603 [Engystomops pustulosus]|uniref:Uncharacterized protein n=1 Tax=Engystomops pustulosus TaxID=76066 RepID=A0AAV6Z990_ENGPU|nr:hypothetical protein GDO81_026603 [Engystomops pustulosus]